MQLTRKGSLATSYLVPHRIGQCESQEHLQTNLHAVRRQNKGPPAAMRYQHSRIRLTRTDLHRHSQDQRAQHRLWDRSVARSVCQTVGLRMRPEHQPITFGLNKTPCSRLGHTGHFRTRPSICCTAVEMQREILTALCAIVRAAHKWKNVNQCGSMLSR